MVALAEMAVTTFIAFLEIVRDGVNFMVGIGSNIYLEAQPGGELASIPIEVSRAIEDMSILALFGELDFDAAFGYVTFRRAKKVL